MSKFQGKITEMKKDLDGIVRHHLSVEKDGKHVNECFPKPDSKTTSFFVEFIQEALKQHEYIEFWLHYVYSPDIILPLIDLIIQYGKRIRVMWRRDVIAAYDHHCNLTTCRFSPMNLFLSELLCSESTPELPEAKAIKEYAVLLVKWQKQQCQLKLAGAI